MNTRVRTCLFVVLGFLGWAAFSPAEANAQGVTVFGPGVTQYYSGGYGGYTYAPQYYGGYTYPQQYYGYGTTWNGYGAGYPAYGYSRSYGYPSTYSYPAYVSPSYGYRGSYRTGYRGGYYRY